MASHLLEEQKFSFRLSFGEGPKLQEWIIHEPVERFDLGLRLTPMRTFIGVSSPHGIVPLSRASVCNSDDPITEFEYHPFPNESEFITTHEFLALPLELFLSFSCLKELRLYSLDLIIGPNVQFPSSAPLFHTLKVLAVRSAPPSFLAGQTFHKLERFQEVGDEYEDINPGHDPLTEMLVCTRLVAPLSRLATLKLPQIRELVVVLDHQEPDYLWEKYIAVNANLSGLELLSLCAGDHEWLPFINITKILGSLPDLETLVLDSTHLVVPYLAFFKAFIPMKVQGTSGVNQSSQENPISGVLCPRLGSLRIEGIRLTAQPKLMPVLKDIVTLRAIVGSPLKSFTLYFLGCPGKKWELIGRDRRFKLEEVVPAQEFQLDI